MWLRDTGVLDKMKDDELSAPIPIPDPKIKVDGLISVEQIGIGIAIFSVGMTLSLISFIGELCTKKRVKREKKNQQQAWRQPRKSTMKPLHGKNAKGIGQDIIMPPQMGDQIIGHKK